jgi:hypothetical protein
MIGRLILMDMIFVDNLIYKATFVVIAIFWIVITANVFRKPSKWNGQIQKQNQKENLNVNILK